VKDKNFWIDSDNLVEVVGLANALTGGYINDATITASFTDADDVELAAFGLTYVAASDGDYAGEIPNTVEMTEGDEYTLVVTAVGAGFTLVYRVVRKAAWYEG